MKLFTLCVVLLLGLGLSAFAADAPAKNGKLRHIVLFKFKAAATPAQIKEVEKGFHSLKTNISQISSLEWGTNVSSEKRDQGFTHALIVTFKNEKDRDAYIAHAEHKKFVESALPSIEDVIVVDFWSGN